MAASYQRFARRLLAVITIPLGLLHAAEPPSDAAPEKLIAAGSGIRISVFDSTSDKPIPEFRLIAGVPARGIADEYEKRTGKTAINWQPHTVKIGKDGDYVWPLDKAYDEMALRIEADGYVPQVYLWLKKSAGAQHLVFQLAADAGIKGRVLRPDGQAAVGATVALAMPQRDAVWEDSRIRGSDQPLPEKPSDRWRVPIFVTTDAEGRFQLPSESEAAAVLIVHKSGVRELAYEDFQKSPEIKLLQWGRIEGRVLWKDKPGAGEPLSLSIHRSEYGYPGMVASYAKTQSDAEGRFVFDQVLPGLVQLSRPVQISPTNPSAGSWHFDGLVQHVDVKSGDPTAVVFGGQGRTVTGKLAGRDAWENVTFHFHPNAPHVGFPGDDSAWKAFGEFKKSAMGPLFFRDKQPVNADGTFTIENMLPGTYQIFFSAPGAGQHLASTRFTVEAELFGKAPPPQNLGEIPVKQPAMPPKADKPAAAAPPAKTVTIRGKAVDDETGKPVAPLIVQAGKFDPTDPTRVTWGYSEGRSSATDGSYSTTIRWGDGWTARILADGYLPQPILTKAPPEDKDEIEVLVRLKRGRLVRGLVLDHKEKPVKGAAVFTVGPTGVNLFGGKAINSWGGDDNVPKPAMTDDNGRFELPAGEAKKLAVSGSAIDAWPADIAAEGDTIIRLPQPAKVEIQLDIEGADKESNVFFQLLVSHMPGFEGVRLESTQPIANGGKLTLPALPPGKYQFCRSVTNRLGMIGTGAMLEREFLELKPGETKTINYVRAKGARVRGQLTLPAEKLMGIVVQIRSEKAEQDPFDKHEWATTYASQTANADGSFLTERVAPGTYVLKADAYVPLTPEQERRTGIIVPPYGASAKIVVPESGELVVPELKLVKIR
jgi:hypothetical protein